MRIALSMNTINKSDPNNMSDGIDHNWIKWAEKNGITSYLVPNDLENLNDYVDSLQVDLIVLTGMNSNDEDKRRNSTERKLIEMSIKKRTPLLGTGGGAQFLNKYFGGSVEAKTKTNGSSHEIIFTTPWQNIYKESTSVNSNHTHGMVETGLGKGFKIAAIDPHGFVEAITHDEYPITGIMWRPEASSGNPRDIDLFRSISGSRY